jgi:hypothetical protein
MKISCFSARGKAEYMRRSGLWIASLCWLELAMAGCSRPVVARYIYQDGEFGVVGIPINTYQKKVDFRDQAGKLMARHFPEGYEIVRAEEVIEGERTLDVGKRTELETEPGLAALHQVLKIGRLDRVTSVEQKDKLQVRECRIIYQRKPPGTHGRSGQFALASSIGPSLYIDPNEVLRRQNKKSAELLAKAESTPTKPGDDHPKTDGDLKQASGASMPIAVSQPVPATLNWSFDQLFAKP